MLKTFICETGSKNENGKKKFTLAAPTSTICTSASSFLGSSAAAAGGGEGSALLAGSTLASSPETRALSLPGAGSAAGAASAVFASVIFFWDEK
jgi:hypothetical protein